MKLEDQVLKPSQAARLKILGVAQKSLFYHHLAFDKPVFGETITTEWGKQYKKTQVCNDKKAASSAFTVGELGLLLPPGYDTMYLTDLKWCGYDLDGEHILQEYNTEAECRAAMLINLLEMQVITAEECNKRLLES